MQEHYVVLMASDYPDIQNKNINKRYNTRHAKELLQQCVNASFIKESFCTITKSYFQNSNRHEMTVHPELLTPDTGPSDEMDSEASFRCRAACGLVYKSKATRNK